MIVALGDLAPIDVNEMITSQMYEHNLNQFRLLGAPNF